MQTISKVAIDVVLLPDKQMSDLAIAINKLQIQKSHNNKIALDTKSCLPHISLAMGTIEETDLQKICAILDKTASQFDRFVLTADVYKTNTIPNGDIVSEFGIHKTEQLQSLHETVTLQLTNYLYYNVEIPMLFTPPQADKITTTWIKNYREKSSFENFNPHITLGFGKVADILLPVQFSSNTLALCHLGNYCTCRNVLWSKNLGS